MRSYKLATPDPEVLSLQTAAYAKGVENQAMLLTRPKKQPLDLNPSRYRIRAFNFRVVTRPTQLQPHTTEFVKTAWLVPDSRVCYCVPLLIELPRIFREKTFIVVITDHYNYSLSPSASIYHYSIHTGLTVPLLIVPWSAAVTLDLMSR